MVGKTLNRCRRRSDHTVNIHQQIPSGSNTSTLRHRCDRSINTQQQTLSRPNTHNLHRISEYIVETQQQKLSVVPIAMLGKTPKLHCTSDHTFKTQRQTLSGPPVMLGKTTKLQVELPLHLVVDQILTRLPVKTLNRFRCVSKPLRSFIAHPHFQKVHASRSQQTPNLLVAKSDTTGVHFSTHTLLGEKLLNDFFVSFGRPSNEILTQSFVLVQSCLGLVCLKIDFNGAILIFNPSTAEVITLPECSDEDFELNVGFGYTDLSDEFKVVRFFTRYVNGDVLADYHDEVSLSEVFTLGSSDGWRETTRRPFFVPCGSGHLPLVHGALHFLPSLAYHAHIRDDHYISAFDLGTEQYRGIPLPDIYYGFGAIDNCRQCQMAELRGSLCLSFDFVKSKKLLQLWFLKDYHGGKWVKEYNINLSYEPVPFSPFAVTDDGCVLLELIFSKDEYKLCYYSVQKNCITETFGTNCSAMFYLDSFLPLPLIGKYVPRRS